MTFEKRILLENHTALPSGYKADNLMHESLIHKMVCQCTCTVVRIIYCPLTAHFKLSFIYITVVILILLGTVLIVTSQKEIPNYLHLLLVHYGPNHSGTNDATISLKSKYMRTGANMEPFSDGNLKRTKRNISKILRSAFTIQHHLAQCHEMTCIMCELPGRYIVDRNTPYKYHRVVRVPTVVSLFTEPVFYIF